MTVLSVYQDAMVELIGRKPSTLFGRTAAPELKMQTIVNKAAKQIALDYDWQELTKFIEITGDGEAEDFALPSDFDRLPIDGTIFSDTWTAIEYIQSSGLSDWVRLQSFLPAMPPGYWIIFDKKIHLLPVLGDGAKARFFYISKDIVTKGNGAPASTFTADSDTFVLDEHLLLLSIIWRWKANQGLEYSEDLQNYEIYKSQRDNKNKGPQTIIQGNMSNAIRGAPLWRVGR